MTTLAKLLETRAQLPGDVLSMLSLGCSTPMGVQIDLYPC